MRDFILFITALLSLPSLAQTAPPRPPLRDFLGLNGHTVQFKPTLYAQVTSLVRDYHPVEWDLGKETNVLPDFPFAKNRVHWSTVYGSWKNAGHRTNVCLMFESIPFEQWRDFSRDSATYAAAFASHFGPSAAKPLIESVEIGNEPGQFTDDQYTALLRSTLPAIKEADPKLLTATCNLTTGESHKYAKSVSALRKELLQHLDILTIHTYPQLEPWPTWRRSHPEDSRLDYLKDVMKLAEWRDRNAPGKPIWITEFGYDASTKSPDPKSEFARWEDITDEQQAQFLVRSTLLFTELPVERAYIYFFNDSDTPQLHGSSGLTRNYTPKPAFHAIHHLYKTLGDYRFSKVLIQKENDVYAYQYQHATIPTESIIVLWSPTGAGRTTTVSLPLPKGARITKVHRTPLSAENNPNLPRPDPGKIPVTETPLYLHVTAAPR